MHGATIKIINAGYYVWILMKLEFSLHIFEKYSNTKFDFKKIRPVAAELFHADGRTDGHDEANNRFSQFYENASKGRLVRCIK